MTFNLIGWGSKIKFTRLGLTVGPVLICLPGLIGGPEDFSVMATELGKKYAIVITDPNHEARESEGLNLSLETMKELNYDSTSESVKDYLIQNLPNQKYYFLGVSLGGKVVYDFASKFPELFSGGVVTDVGPGPFSESEIFKLVKEIVDQSDLTLPWPELKKSLMLIVPDKNLRILIQSQIAYPHRTPPGVWKTGMQNFENFLKVQSLDDQEDLFKKVDTLNATKEHIIHVLHAGKMSGIGDRMYKAMLAMRSLKLYEYPEATHFLHISHADDILKITLGLRGN